MKKIVFGIIICILSTTMIFAAEKLSKLNSALMKDKVNINTVKKLIASGEDVNQKYYGYYPIERVKNNFELVKILIEAGAEGKEKYFANAIWNQYDDEIIQYFCENDFVDSNKYVWGFRNYFRDNGKSIEDICAKVKAITVGKLTNPMILSLVTPDKYDAVCEALNPDFNYKDEMGNSLIHLASKSINENSLELIKYAVKKGVGINCLNSSNQTALLFAATYYGPLINWENPVNENEESAKINFIGDMPYYGNARAIQKAQVEVVMFLLDNKINVNQIDDFGWAVLHYASAAYPEGLIELLISKGADKNIKTKFGRTYTDILNLRK